MKKTMKEIITASSKGGQQMKGSILAAEIVEEMKRKEVYRKRAKEKQCKLNNKKQCNECEYKNNCEVK